MHIPCAKIHKRAAMLDWDSLRYFLEVARTQRVSAAARKLGV